MNALLAVAVGVLIGAGAALVVARDLVRAAVGVFLLSSAGALFLMAAGLSRGRAPLHPLPAGSAVSDPVVQALTLTTLVIGFGVSLLVLALAWRVWSTLGTLDPQKLRASEREDERQLDEAGAVR